MDNAKKKLVHVPDQFKGDELLELVQGFFYANYPDPIPGHLGHAKFNYSFGEYEIPNYATNIAELQFFFDGNSWLNRMFFPTRPILRYATVFVLQDMLDYIVHIAVRESIAK